MSVCRNPFAIKNGEMIFIDDLSESERGLSCGCICPVCEDKFIARMGDVKVHHFAHSNEGCSETLAYTTGLYMMLKQMFDEGCAFYVPALVVGYYIHSCKHISLDTVEQFVKILPETTLEDYTIVVAKGKYIKFDSAELSYDKRNHIQALELSYNGRSMAIKVRHRIQFAKLEQLQDTTPYQHLKWILEMKVTLFKTQTVHFFENMFQHLKRSANGFTMKRLRLYILKSSRKTTNNTMNT